ncbi:hypothetical protein [Leifsonia sp. Leaf264]|uniref:hypothetical protein n=1 Tax=Leifsonia sp. Leaf264 TaxID=1736314 RepID=UPI000ABA9199|nr:hypothetical protein [Leifsonia sp. Leaf264]
MEQREGETLHEQRLRTERAVRETLADFTPEEQVVIAAFLDDVTEPEGPAT